MLGASDQIHVARNERRFEPARDQIAVRKRRQRNARKNRDAKTALLGLPPNRVVEMGRGSIWSDMPASIAAPFTTCKSSGPKQKNPRKRGL
ncbi:hypothetical protein [Paraburkholderia youngii]|uniref:hypothetical protein n=1 Tax=Paraburkholderia youngii TaxID=2782701 RepID=UPI003D1980B1